MDKSWKFLALGVVFVTLLSASSFIAYIYNQRKLDVAAAAAGRILDNNLIMIIFLEESFRPKRNKTVEIYLKFPNLNIIT